MSEMDSEDLVVIDSGPAMHGNTSSSSDTSDEAFEKDNDTDNDSETDFRPLIHTDTDIRSGKYRYHNYMRESNNNCELCHDLLLQAWRDIRFGSYSRPVSVIAPVG